MFMESSKLFIGFNDNTFLVASPKKSLSFLISFNVANSIILSSILITKKSGSLIPLESVDQIVFFIISKSS